MTRHEIECTHVRQIGERLAHGDRTVERENVYVLLRLLESEQNRFDYLADLVVEAIRRDSVSTLRTIFAEEIARTPSPLTRSNLFRDRIDAMEDVVE